MPFSKCRDVLDRVSAIVDGEAGAIARVRFFSHLAMCHECTRYYRQFQAIRQDAGTVTEEDLPDFDRVMGPILDSIDQEEQRDP